MYGVFINDDSFPYTDKILEHIKTIETRTKNMLLPLVGERVAIIRTGKGKKPLVVGYVDITNYAFCPVIMLDAYRNETCIPVGSTFDNLGTRDGRQGKWFYYLENAVSCNPYKLPSSAIYHGRSWCEF